VVPLGARRRWYRYHQLFAELLRHELDRAEPVHATTSPVASSAGGSASTRREPTCPFPYDPDQTGQDFEALDDADATANIDAYKQEIEHAHAAVAGKQLDDVMPSHGDHPERTRDIRWIYLHMIEEYARHNGHADLIRERIGWKILTYQTSPNDEGRVTVIIAVREWPYEEQKQRTADRAKLLMDEFWSQMFPRKRSD
jgi:hypothetical protein